MRFMAANRLHAWILLVILSLAGCDDVTRFPESDTETQAVTITDAVIVGDADGSAVMRWTVPDAGAAGALMRYDIRYRYGDAFDWESAIRVTTPPPPAAPGQVQEYRFIYPEGGRTLTAALRTIDVAGNLSPLSNVARLLIPGSTVSGVSRCLLDRTAADVVVILTTDEFVLQTESDEQGRWEFRDLPEISAVIRIEGTRGEFYPIQFTALLDEDRDYVFDMMELGNSELYPAVSRLSLFKEAVGFRASSPRMRSWRSRPVAVYVPEFTTIGGLDYRQAAIDAMNRWMELTGKNLFQVADTPPDVGVVMRFRTPADMGTQIGYTEHTDSPDGYPLRSDISIVNSFENPAALSRVMLHELGHTIRLYHLPPGFLMYGGQPLPADPTADEIWIVQALVSLTDGTDMSFYQEIDP